MLLKYFYRYLQDPEFQSLLSHYVETGELVIMRSETANKEYYFLPEKFEEFKRAQEQKKASQ